MTAVVNRIPGAETERKGVDRAVLAAFAGLMLGSLIASLNLTLVAPMKLLPLIVTSAPPLEGPFAGVTLVTVGGGGVPAATARAVPMLVPSLAKTVSATT